jgi:hypothetical protein
LQRALQATQESIQPITDASRGPRHGDLAYIPGEITSDITRRSWILMNRFLEYKRRGDKPLPAEEFAVLN